MPIPEQVKQNANIIFLLDRVDALVAMGNYSNRLAAKEDLQEKIVKFKGLYFQPDLVDIFLEAAEKEAFWITQEPIFLTEHRHNQKEGKDKLLLNDIELYNIAGIFAEIVDAKSPFTAEHSEGVASLAGFLAKRCQLSETTQHRIRTAGLLHDLGKMQIPDTILDYAGGLEGDSLTMMRHHSYITHMILSKISGLEKITRWAADHHEKLDGSGYPFRRKDKELPIESRIIMVADIFQALAQNRPYRTSMPANDILDIMVKLASEGKIDGEVMHIVRTETEECYRTATLQAC